MRRIFFLLWSAVLLTAVCTSCSNNPAETEETAVVATPETAVRPTEPSQPLDDNNFIVIATDAPNPPFTQFDPFGNVIGYNSTVIEALSRIDGFEYEFVVTPYEGVLDVMAAQPGGDIDAVMVPVPIPTAPPEGIAYTAPYLELGQMLVVLADDTTLQSSADISSGMKIGVVGDSSSEQTALEVMGLSSDQIVTFDKSVAALTALVAEELDAAIVDSYSAEYFAGQFPEQLKIVGGNGRSAWLSAKAYGLAVAAANQPLLTRLNAAIAQADSSRTLQQLGQTAFLPTDPFDPGESRVGTTSSMLVLGVLGDLADMDPAGNPDLLRWEVMNNVMSGLYRLEATGPVPNLITGPPQISDDKLTYTFSLRPDVAFSNGRSLTADDVKWSIARSARLGNFLVNAFLKDSNDDGFADEDAVQVLDPLTVRLVLQIPTAYLPSLLATPPFFPLDSSCYAETADPTSVCGGIGRYTIADWAVGESLTLQANPTWFGDAPNFETLQLGFYSDPGSLRRALERFQSVDMAINAFGYQEAAALARQDQDGDGAADYTLWDGPTFFKSYLVFEQSQEPWDKKQIRQAAAYALDRDALAVLFGGSRRPLLSPIPDTIPFSQPVYPARDLERARALLLQAGYSAGKPLEITIRYENNGRYSPQEADYANLIKQQLEETGVFQVTLEGVVWESFRAQISQCAYSTYLIGWPTPGQPTNYMDATSWTDFFIENTSSGFCSNYESEPMTRLLEQANEATDPAARQAVYSQIQQLWATDLPTLDLLQEPRRVLSLAKVGNVTFDPLGLLDYGTLTKSGE